MRFLMVYGTTEGHTRAIAGRIAEAASALGHETHAADADSLSYPLDLSRHDAVLVGASVHQGRHQESIREFVLANKEALQQIPTAFFSVSLSAAVQDDVHQAEARGYVEAFLEDTGWQPDQTARFAGAVRHAKYDYFKNLVLKMLDGQLGPGVIRGEDIVYTDWDAVTAFACSFAELAERGEPARSATLPRAVP